MHESSIQTPVEGRWALVPVKTFSRAKSRLAAQLSPGHRAALAREMLVHVLNELRQVDTLDGVVLLSDEPEADAVARAYGAHAMHERPGHLASVIDAGLQTLSDAELVLIVLADLPRLLASDIAAMLALGERHPLVLAPDVQDEGTNALLLRPPTTIPTCFGRYGSFTAHLQRAARHELDAAVLRRRSLGFDIDTPRDLEQLVNDEGPRFAALEAAGLYGPQRPLLTGATGER